MKLKASVCAKSSCGVCFDHIDSCINVIYRTCIIYSVAVGNLNEFMETSRAQLFKANNVVS